MIALYLDDLRAAPQGWTQVYTVAEAIALLRTGTVEWASLDHDLGDGQRECGRCWLLERPSCAHSPGDAPEESGCTCDCHRRVAPSGYDLCLWMAETGTWPKRKPSVHSANPVGAANMRAVIERYWPGAG